MYPKECPHCGSDDIVADYQEAVCQGVEIAEDGQSYDYDGSLDSYDDSSTHDECLRCRSCSGVVQQFGRFVFIDCSELEALKEAWAYLAGEQKEQPDLSIVRAIMERAS